MLIQRHKGTKLRHFDLRAFVSSPARNMKSLSGTIETMEDHMEMLIARGLDIARGGNGKVEKASKHPEAVAEEGEA